MEKHKIKYLPLGPFRRAGDHERRIGHGKEKNMGITGLGTYSSTSYYLEMRSRGKNSNVGNESAFGLTPKTDGEQTDVAPTSNKTAVGAAQTAYSRCITANIKSEELVARKSADGEMIYSYQASEQSFKIWINSDGSNKTYSIEGIDKDGQPFTKEFDPYDVDPEDADFPEFAALCMYIQNTDETADMLANEYFATDDILEKCDYLDKMQGFSLDGFFEKTQAMMDNLDKLVSTLCQISGMRNDINSFFEPFFTKYLVEDVDLEDYPDIAGKISEDLSSEKVSDEKELEEVVTPLGFGFANAGMMGYGMSAALVEKPDTDDTIIRVKIATGNGDESIDVNLSNFDPRNATPVEMFAYCQYKDAIGEGVNSKWGSWNAMKNISSTYDGCDFGSLDNIMNKKMNWSGKLAKSETLWVDPKTNKVTMSAADLIKMLEESHKLTSQELKEDKDWREMSDEEWDKMMDGIDKYIDAFKERLKQMREAQQEAAAKAALEADPEDKTIAASSAALAAANGFESGSSNESENSEEGLPTMDGEVHEKNWTKLLDTDDQTVLMEAEEAQKMEVMAQKRIEEIVSGNSEYDSYEYVSVTDSISQKNENSEVKEPLKLIAMDRNGIRCINDDSHEVEWEIKFNSEAEYKKAAKLMKWAGSHMNNYMAATDEKQWKDFLTGKISEGSFKNILKTQEV